MSLRFAISDAILGDRDSHVRRNRVNVPRIESNEFRARNTIPHQTAECSSNVLASIANPAGNKFTFAVRSKLFFVDRRSSPIGDVVVAAVADAANAPLAEATNVNGKRHPILTSTSERESPTMLFEFSRRCVSRTETSGEVRN